MKRFKKLITNSDVFGNIIGFKYKGDDRIKSLFGGLLTISLIILLFVLVSITLENWLNQHFGLEVKMTTFYKDVSKPDTFSSKNIGFRLGVLELFGDEVPANLGELHPMGSRDINQIFIKGQPFLHEKKENIGNIINCHEEETNFQLPVFIKYTDSSFKDTFRNLLCTNISSNLNVTIGSDIIASQQSMSIDTELDFDICKITKNCLDSNALTDIDRKKFRLFFELNDHLFDKLEPTGHRDTFSSFTHHQLDFSKDLVIDIVISKYTVKTDPNFIFNFQPPYFHTFYSSVSNIMETPRPHAENRDIMRVSVVFRAILRSI